MQSHARFPISPAFVIILAIAVCGFGQPAETQTGANDVARPAFPYVAEIVADDVYIRSGPGTNYYFCGKLNKGDSVKIVSDRYSWLRIVPPKGSYSWISKQYVEADPQNPLMGTVTGDAVRVYAGSDSVLPMHSTTMQGKLDKTSRVALLGVEQDGYYKIAPPDFAYLWVSTKYTKPLAEAARPAEPAPVASENAEQPQAGSQTKQPAVAPVTIPLEDQRLREYYALKEKVEAERARPIEQQNYADTKKALRVIADDKNAGKAARYAEFVLAQIKRYELARKIALTLKLQEQQFVETQQRIEEARTARLKEYQDLGRFAAVGRFATSSIYGDKKQPYYRIVDDNDKIVCYAAPIQSAENIDPARFLDKKVGLVGTIEPHPASGGALVKFADIVLVGK